MSARTWRSVFLFGIALACAVASGFGDAGAKTATFSVNDAISHDDAQTKIARAKPPSTTNGADEKMREDFIDPPQAWKTCPGWFWNSPPSRAETEAIIDGCHAIGYQGFGIAPTERMGLEFMSPEYLDRYEEAVAKAASLGMKVCLYGEFMFPSGGAGGQLEKIHPEALGKRLDMLAKDVVGPRSFDLDIPAGKLMAAVAMNAETRERLDLSRSIHDGRLKWSAPVGEWKVMLFTCVTDGARGLVDYLDPDAVRKYISLTYEKYYERLRPYFGKTIDTAFYDEPTLHWIQGGRAWTPSFNERYEKRYGSDPSLLYPALWLDIGPDTAAARDALFGFRADLFSDGFAKTIADWSAAHHLELAGHVDQEEVLNPTCLCGDLMKCFRSQQIPSIDQIFEYDRASPAYKIVSSAAVNYDRRRVMSECFGAMDRLPVANLYKETMDQFARGINMIGPHAVWYDPSDVIFPPELSYRTKPYAEALPAYNRYAGRLQRILQFGNPVAEIGVLYPIAGLHAAYRFDVGDPYLGGVIPDEADYMAIGLHLSLDLRHDFTFIHPDTLDEKCRAEDGAIRLRHPRWSQRYRLFIVPGCSTIRASNLRKIKEFYDQGGAVVFTTRIPERSAEFGRDAEVKRLLAAMLGDGYESLGDPNANPAKESASFCARRNDRGGATYFIGHPDARTLDAVVRESLKTPDVTWETSPQVKGGHLSYLHKIIDGRDFYFFANSSDGPVETYVRLRGSFEPEIWDPHDGRIAPADFERIDDRGESAIRIRLSLPPVHSIFIVAKAKSKALAEKREGD